MDTLAQYRQIIVETLNKYAELLNRSSSVKQQATVVSDQSSDHYLLTLLGWRGTHRIKGNIVHIRLADEKVWIEEDSLENGIATDLMKAGIPKEAIVLAFYHPDMRSLTEFAVA